VRNLAKICAVVALCLGMTGAVRADNRPRPGMARAPAGGSSTVRTPLSRRSPIAGRARPAAMVSAPRKPLSFAKVAGPGPTRLKADTAVLVVANCPFRLLASFHGFVGETPERAAILPKEMKVTINGKDVPIGTEFVEIATGGPTPPSGVEVPIVVEITTSRALAYPAGRYGGNLAITVRGG
jgi:hypothetical protein